MAGRLIFMKKIDIHCHVTNRALHDLAVQSGSLDDIVREMKEYDIEKTVVLATYFTHKSSGISNYRIYDWIRERPEFIMFGSLDFEHYFYQGYNELEELAEKGAIKGIKVYTGYQDIDLESAKFGSLADLAKHFSLPMMFHMGSSYSTLRKYGISNPSKAVTPMEMERLAQKYPYVKFIMSHMCDYADFDDLITVINGNYNLYADMSGQIDSKYDRHWIPKCIENITRFVRECGSGKLLFGTDFPVQTHSDSVYFIEQALKDFPSCDKENIYYNNAWRLLQW